MECSCVYVDHDSTWEFCNIRMPKAKRHHKCHECRRLINPGEKYEYTSGICDGEFTNHKMCLDCLSIRDAFFCDGWIYEELHENLKDHIHDSKGEISESCIAELTPKAQEVVCEMVEFAWEYWNE